MLEWIEFFCRWILGLQLLFWGLNGIFHWKPIPPSAEVIDNFTKACIDSKFIMPIVKVFEILFGALMLTPYGTLLTLMALAPLIFVISGLHLLHNRKAWQVLLPITLPYLVILILNFEKWKQVFLV